jgi:hypothetical protein
MAPSLRVTLHTDQGSIMQILLKDVKPLYASLLEEILGFLKQEKAQFLLKKRLKSSRYVVK